VQHHHRKRAPRGRRSTTPAPSIEELLTVTIDRREAFLSGHQAALFDELQSYLIEAYRRNDRRPKEDLPVLANGSLDRRIHSDDRETVTVPLWAFDVVYDMVMDRMLKESKGKGPTSRWWQKYRKDLIHWHRYSCVQQALKAKRATRINVYDVVADDAELRVSPHVPDDTWSVLDSCWRDVEAVLDAEDQEAPRVRACGQKVERVH
jgi:hypothetical protein